MRDLWTVDLVGWLDGWMDGWTVDWLFWVVGFGRLRVCACLLLFVISMRCCFVFLFDLN